MQLKKIESRIDEFKVFLQSKQAYDRVYLWDIQRDFQAQWDLSLDDLPAMFDQSIQSKVSTRLWNRHSFEPKKMMKFFFETEPDYVKSVFVELFDEEKSFDGRLDRFMYYSNQLLGIYKQKNPNSVENNHYQNHQMISFYLTMKYPKLYTIYEFDGFIHLLTAIGTLKIPNFNDLPRFVKITRTLYNFLLKDDELISLHQARFKKFDEYPADSLLLVYDFMKFDMEDDEH